MPYLVDGNNLWGSWGGPRTRPDGRRQVLQVVSSFCQRRGASAVVVFDGAPDRPGAATQTFGRVTVRFGRPGEDADAIIRSIVDRREQAADWIVVTSDKSLYSYCKTRGARVLRAHEWNALAGRPPAKAGGSAAAAEKPDSETDIDGWMERFERRSRSDVKPG